MHLFKNYRNSLGLCLMCAALFVGCSEDEKKSENPPEKCTYEAPKCNADGTALLTCKDGTETSKACKCVDNACQDENKCNYTGSKCNEAGTALLTCNDGSETSQTCKCVDNACQEEPECDYTGSKCNDTNTALLTCNNGKETSQTCKCEDNACQEEPECDYTGSKCNEAKTALLTCNNGKETSQECKCENNACQEEPECDYTGSKCNDTNTALLTCDNGKEISENCPCYDNKCSTDICDVNMEPTCDADHRAVTCVNGYLKRETCGDGLICSNGYCVTSSQEGECTFDVECTPDKSSVRKCTDSNITITPCANTEYCDPDAKECVSAIVNGKCDEATFRDYCDGRTRHFCNSNQRPDYETCPNTCVDGVCQVNTSHLGLGDTCNPYTYTEKCMDEVPTKCDKNSKKVVSNIEEDSCTDKDMICGEIMVNEVREAGCFVECNELGKIKQECILQDDGYHHPSYACISIGNNRLGYSNDYIEDTWNEICEDSCEAGECVSSHGDIDHLGEECPANFEAYCLASNLAVSCEFNGEGKNLVTATTCETNEICAVETNKSSAKCYEPCTSGDPTKYVCEDATGIYANSNRYVQYSVECQKVGDKDVYVRSSTPRGCKSQCKTDGTCR